VPVSQPVEDPVASAADASANIAIAIAHDRYSGLWVRVKRASMAWANSDEIAVATKASATTTCLSPPSRLGCGVVAGVPRPATALRENVHKVGTLGGRNRPRRRRARGAAADRSPERTPGGTDSRFSPHPRGDGRASAAVLPGAPRDRRPGDRNGLVGA